MRIVWHLLWFFFLIYNFAHLLLFLCTYYFGYFIFFVVCVSFPCLVFIPGLHSLIYPGILVPLITFFKTEFMFHSRGWETKWKWKMDSASGRLICIYISWEILKICSLTEPQNLSLIIHLHLFHINCIFFRSL